MGPDGQASAADTSVEAVVDESVGAGAPEVEPEPITFTLDEYLAKSGGGSTRAQVTRRANEGSDESQWKQGRVLTREQLEEEANNEAKVIQARPISTAPCVWSGLIQRWWCFAGSGQEEPAQPCQDRHRNRLHGGTCFRRR